MDKSDLKMYPIVPNPDVYKIKRELPPILQKPPFVKILLGQRGSSKTTSMVNEVMRKDMYGDRKGEDPIFDDIIIYSSTLGNDESSRHLVKKATATYDQYDDNSIKRLIEYQKEKPKKERRHILVICDDIGGMITSRNSHIFSLVANHRHYLVSMYFLIQAPRMIPPLVRSNFTSMYINRLPNASEQDKVFEDLAFLGDKKMIKKLYDYSTKKPYHFLMVDGLTNSAYKWGACDPEFLWTKYSENGDYNKPFEIPKNSNVDDLNE